MRSVGDAALKMVIEVRRQFKEIPGIMEGTAKPDYNRCIAISTKAALREMIFPGIITVVLPIIVRFTLGKEAAWRLVGWCNSCWRITCVHDGQRWWRMG